MIQEALAEPYAITIERILGKPSIIYHTGRHVCCCCCSCELFHNHFFLDGEPRWLNGIILFTIRLAKLKELRRGFKKIQSSSQEIMESLGTSLIEALMILVEFMPILFGLSISIPIFFFGEWEYGLVVGALLWSIGGTLFLIGLGLILRLVGVEYDLQKQEAAYRKMLVIAEDDETVRPKTLEELFNDVRQIHFLSYIKISLFLILVE